MRIISIVLLQAAASVLLVSCSNSNHNGGSRIQQEMHENLVSGIFETWYPLTIDSLYGGYLGSFSHDWKAMDEQSKMLVTQARHIWTTSRAAMYTGEQEYGSYARHGYRFLRDKMMDTVHGGFYMMCDRQGVPAPIPAQDNKSAYGTAFTIYALTALYETGGDEEVLDLAQKTFAWMEAYLYDPVYGGYFNSTNWKQPEGDRGGSALVSGTGARTDWKDQNSSIHIMEAFTDLYRLWPDSLLRVRLQEMLHLIRDTITYRDKYLVLFLERNWTPVSFRDSTEQVREANYALDNVSFGHDMETAWLMLDAARVLGEAEYKRTLPVAKKMIDHSLSAGWDETKGGVYYSGYYFRDGGEIAIINDNKSWWVQAEALYALLLMDHLFPGEKKYHEAFVRQWNYIKKYMIDREHGGWYASGLDTRPGSREAPKAENWKVNYHNARALMKCIEIIDAENEP